MTPEQALMQEMVQWERTIAEFTEAERFKRRFNPARASTYRAKNGNDLLCPVCWLRDRYSTMRSLQGTEDYDLIKCNDNSCAREVVIDF